MSDQFHRITSIDKRVVRSILLFAAAVCWILPGIAHAATGSDTSAAESCEALKVADFSGVTDAPTQVTDAGVMTPGGGSASYCRVIGYVSNQVGFELRLPLSNWNGRFLRLGCGGFCGTTENINWCPSNRGYACITTDQGHQGPGVLWADHNLQAKFDFGIRAAHVTALAGKAITERYYGKSSSKSYFFGCSGGGQEALTEAQRFPWDFDGIIAIAGVPYLGKHATEAVWRSRALQGSGGRSQLSHDDLQLLHNEAVSRCDMDDGVRDGIISDPYHCKVDPSVLACDSTHTTRCLTAEQIQAVKRVYAGPATSRGARGMYLRGLPPGSELDWLFWNESGVGDARQAWRLWILDSDPGPGWSLADFDFDRDYKRLGINESLSGASNPDLTQFKASGAKLILVHGWTDGLADPSQSIDYYEMAERAMGGKSATQDFFRLFMIPGMKHCSGGDGAFAIDYLSYLENWVERDRAPDKLIGAHVDSKYLQSLALREYADDYRDILRHRDNLTAKEADELAWVGAFSLFAKFPLSESVPITFSRAIYPYPLVTQYKGKGDPNRADSFKAVERRSKHTGAPVTAASP